MISDLSRRAAGRAPAAAAVIVALAVWVVLLGPLAVLLSKVSPHSFTKALGAPGALNPLWNSLEASAVALGIMVVFGTPLAYVIARWRRAAVRVLEAGVVLPLLMPPLVVGLLLIFLIGQAGPIGRVVSGIDPNVFGVNTFFALVVAEVYEAAPYYVITAAAALTTIDRRLEQDAQLLGDTAAGAFSRVTLPLAAPGLATGLAVAWARAMGAFGAVLIVAYNPAGLPIAIDKSFIANGLTNTLPFALLLIVAALPLPLIVLLWSAHARRRQSFSPSSGFGP